MVKHTHAGILVELVVALGILASVMIPLSYSFVFEQRQCRAAYQRAITMEIVDGEMEVLVAGEWRRYGEGVHKLTSPLAATQNLPSREMALTITGQHLRLQCGAIVREGSGR